MQKLHLPRNYWLGLLIMLVAYTLVQFLFYHPLFLLPDWVKNNRQVVRWINILFIYVVGIFIIRTMKPDWLLFLWNLVHVLLIAYLLLAIAYEYFIAPMPYGIRASGAPIIEFLISPIFYMAMGLIYSGLYSRSEV